MGAARKPKVRRCCPAWCCCALPLAPHSKKPSNVNTQFCRYKDLEGSLEVSLEEAETVYSQTALLEAIEASAGGCLSSFALRAQAPEAFLKRPPPARLAFAAPERPHLGAAGAGAPR